MIKKQKTQCEETENASEPDSDVAGALDWSAIKTAVINMLRTLADKVDHMQKQMGREMAILRKNQKC